MSTPDDPNDPLAGYDLAAWSPPAPPAGMAATVVTRMTTQPPAAVRVHVAAQKQSLRTVFAAAGATLVASAAIAVLVMTHHAAPAAQVVETGPVASPAPLAPPRGALPAGAPEDDAHVAALEKRVLELEVAVERLRAELQIQEQQQQRSLPPLAPRPVVVEPRAIDPFDTQHGPSRDDGALCDPFESAHGCHVERTPPPSAAALAPGAGPIFPSVPCDPFSSRRAGCGPDASASATGEVLVRTKPVAHIVIDGQDTGKISPAVLVLPVGKHQVTVEVNGDKYTYALVIQPGETTTFDKDLQ